ncbi:MAG TPA: peptide-methionine (S)-S-oxide reductase MsrA [Polyangiaceae bacterium]|nr:peptide-methionine (S)-S-oxide reductase MsrA [Polyangiaceae bacterium]
MRSLSWLDALPALLVSTCATLALGCGSSALDGPSTAEPTVEAEHARAPLPRSTRSTGADDTNGHAVVLGDAGGAGDGTPLHAKQGHALAAFAAGCFWGVEDAFRKLPGVTATAVGYAGGHVDHPTYERVCDHDTGHAETVLVEFDPERIAYAKLLRAFFQIHDPTTLDRQGPDVGDQYRSEIFTFDDAQAKAAREAIEATQKALGARVVTKVEAMPAFWRAEDYHQQYAEKNGYHGCPTGKLDGLL